MLSQKRYRIVYIYTKIVYLHNSPGVEQTDRQDHGRDLMRGSVPGWVGIAYDQRERSADSAVYAADADVRETCASSRLSD